MAPPVMTTQLRDACLLLLLIASSVQTRGQPEKVKTECYKDVKGTIHDYEALPLNGKERVQFSEYVGKYVLIVNVATYCNLTGQYYELNALQEALKIYNLVVLGFPCNQFGKQEPGENSEILLGLKYVRPGRDFVPNFRLFAKGDVNGDKEQSIFTFLKRSCPHPSEVLASSLKQVSWEPIRVHDIRWNFEKFLVGRNGVPIMRWSHQVPVSTVKSDILAYLEHIRRM